MPLDLEGLQDAESRQLLILMVDVIFAFQQRVGMVAAEVLNLFLGDKASNQSMLLACALSSYLMAFRADELADNHIGTSINSPQPMIFMVMLTLKLRDRLFEFGHGKIANEFLKHLEDKLVRLSKPDHGRFLEFQSLLHSQLNPG